MMVYFHIVLDVRLLQHRLFQFNYFGKFRGHNDLIKIFSVPFIWDLDSSRYLDVSEDI
jgi:hypothetical protein